MPAWLPLIASFLVGFVVTQLTGSPRVGQAAGLFALGGTVFLTGSIRLSGLVFDGGGARVIAVGLVVVGLVRLLIEEELEPILAVPTADTGAR